MRLKTIYSSPTDKQIYETNKALERSYGANTPVTSTTATLVTDEAQTILAANPNRKSLTIGNPSTEILYITFGIEAAVGEGTYIQPSTSYTFYPVSTSYVSAIIADDVTISITEL